MGDIKPVAWIDAEDLARLRCGITRDVKTATVYSASMGGGCARLYDEATVAGLIVESDGWKQQVMDEMTANLEFRAAGGAMPGEDMPTFCNRLIAERDALRADADRYRALRFAYLAQSPAWADIIKQVPVFNQVTFDAEIDKARASNA